MQPIHLHGKPNRYVRLLNSQDLPALEQFCNKCKELGLDNNKDFQSIKLDKMSMPYGQFFVAVEDDTIFSLAGVHRLDEFGPHAWRCLFRGAQLPGYTPAWSMDIFNSGIHFSYFLYSQIKFIQQVDPNAEFFISTNVDNPSAGSSSRLDKIMMPRLAKKGYWSLYKSNYNLYSTNQNIWKVDIARYMECRDLWLSSENCTD